MESKKLVGEKRKRGPKPKPKVEKLQMLMEIDKLPKKIPKWLLNGKYPPKDRNDRKFREGKDLK